MADIDRGNRPLSPHLTIYRPQITSISSIFIRITGNAMIVAFLLIAWWFVAASGPPVGFNRVNGILTSWFGDLVFTLSLWALWYHALGGLRHLVWDSGRLLEIETAEMLGWACFIGSAVLTVLTLLLV